MKIVICVSAGYWIETAAECTVSTTKLLAHLHRGRILGQVSYAATVDPLGDSHNPKLTPHQPLSLTAKKHTLHFPRLWSGWKGLRFGLAEWFMSLPTDHPSSCMKANPSLRSLHLQDVAPSNFAAPWPPASFTGHSETDISAAWEWVRM